jgi:hypothetical protein
VITPSPSRTPRAGSAAALAADAVGRVASVAINMTAEPAIFTDFVISLPFRSMRRLRREAAARPELNQESASFA